MVKRSVSHRFNPELKPVKLVNNKGEIIERFYCVECGSYLNHRLHAHI